MSAKTGPHLHAIAAVLETLSADLEGFGTTLCADADFVRRHVGKLQAIDLIAQKQRALAALLNADCLDAECLDAAVADICLDELRIQLGDLLDEGGWQQI